MAVRKPVKKINVDALIEKGARVKNDTVLKKSVYLNLRIPYHLLQQLDQAVEARIGINRTGFILEAIQQKLERE